jgi:enolase
MPALVSKYNQLLRIEPLLGENAVYAGTSALRSKKWGGTACRRS